MIILYLDGLNSVVRLSLGGVFDGAWLYSKRFSLLKLFLQKCVFLVFDFDSLLELKLLLEILDIGDQLEVNSKSS